MVNKIPEPKPTFAEGVLRYLREHNVDVQPVIEPGEPVSKYTYKGQVISLKNLVEIANRHRKRRRLPRFKLPIEGESSVT